MRKRSFDFIKAFGISNVSLLFPHSPSSFSQCHRSIPFKACGTFLIPVKGASFWVEKYYAFRDLMAKLVSWKDQFKANWLEVCIAIISKICLSAARIYITKLADKKGTRSCQYILGGVSPPTPTCQTLFTDSPHTHILITKRVSVIWWLTGDLVMDVSALLLLLHFWIKSSKIVQFRTWECANGQKLCSTAWLWAHRGGKQFIRNHALSNHF